MNHVEREEIRHHLELTLERLTEEEARSRSRVEPCADENEFASRVAEHELSVVMHERLHRRIEAITQALKKLSNYDFGTCEECGEDIGLARLKANPLAGLCITCQSVLESSGLPLAM